MLRNLRDRLILSHVLPLIIILPLMGLALTYLLETRYLLPQIAQDLTGTALMLAKIAGAQPDQWFSSDHAQHMLQNTIPLNSAQVMLLSTDSRLIATSLPVEGDDIGQKLYFAQMDKVLSGQTVQTIHYSPSSSEEAVDIFTPAKTADGQVVGIVRLTYHASIFYQEFNQFRGLIAATLLLALVVGAVIGYLLALNISRPIQQVTRLVYEVAQGDLHEPQMEYGPEEIRLLLRAVNYLGERLNNLEQARRQLLANLVHELGRPLGALRSAIQAIGKGAGRDPELLQELAQGMDEEAIRLQRLLEDLAHLHDQSLGVMELNLQPLSLSDWLPGVLRPWEHAAQEKRQHWEINVPKNLPTVQADPARMAQVIGNLVSNAIKYTPVSGTVKVEAGADAVSAWVRVSDTGPGIPLEDQDKIFSPYYRGSQARRIPQGMGLGLSIARDLVSAHDGRLEVESTPGLGSSFILRLPHN